VVLINFWTLTCINWLRTAPYVRAWSQAYREDGLIVIGVHTPEFTFERDIELVRNAIVERRLDYPVALDPDYSIWDAFDNHVWPALYFLDREGRVRENDYGEGGYERDELIVQQLLGVRRETAPVEALGIEAEADWDELRSPETYLGFGRGSRLASPDGVAVGERRTYRIPSELPLNQWALRGEWTIDQECASSQRAECSIAFRCHARDAHLVLSTRRAEPIRFRMTLDGEPPGDSHGVDVDERGDGLLSGGRLYQLVRQAGDVRERTVAIEFMEPGAEAYAFTFG
jgi:hypothetical protein